MRIWPILGGAAVLAAAAGVAGVVASGSSDGDDGTAPDDPVAEQTFVDVVQRDLVQSEQFDGTVGHGPTRPLLLAGSGTLTALPAPGDTIAPGDTVAEVDGAPIIALAGPTPMWRALGPGVDDGRDILQLEYTLATLGYAQEHGVTVDDEWTSATTRAVKAFQEDHGQDDDGTVDVGEIVWIDGSVRVDSVGGTLGQQATEAAIEVTAPGQVVLIDVAVADADLLPLDGTVGVELPTGQVVSGTVTSVGAAETNDSGTTLPVEITLSGADAQPDGMPVDVIADVTSAQDVIAVPVEAVLALAEGGYAVEVRLTSGDTRLVGVELGVFADGYVEITGEVAAGDQVVVP